MQIECQHHQSWKENMLPPRVKEVSVEELPKVQSVETREKEVCQTESSSVTIREPRREHYYLGKLKNGKRQ